MNEVINELNEKTLYLFETGDNPVEHLRENIFIFMSKQKPNIREVFSIFFIEIAYRIKK